MGADEDNSSEGQDDEGSEGDREGSAEPEDGAGPSHTEVPAAVVALIDTLITGVRLRAGLCEAAWCYPESVQYLCQQHV